MKSTNRRCSYCRKKITTEDAIIGGLRAFCSYDHLQKFMQSSKGKKARELSVRKELREVREKYKSKGEYIKEAQAAFNKYIRVRDQGKPCISCGNMPESYYGGGTDAGHWRSRGSAPHLRYHTLNCWSQCKRCNRYLSGASTEYRKELINRIGKERVEALEADQTERRFDIEYLKRVKDIFTRRAKIYNKIRKRFDIV